MQKVDSVDRLDSVDRSILERFTEINPSHRFFVTVTYHSHKFAMTSARGLIQINSLSHKRQNGDCKEKTEIKKWANENKKDKLWDWIDRNIKSERIELDVKDHLYSPGILTELSCILKGVKVPFKIWTMLVLLYIRQFFAKCLVGKGGHAGLLYKMKDFEGHVIVCHTSYTDVATTMMSHKRKFEVDDVLDDDEDPPPRETPLDEPPQKKQKTLREVANSIQRQKSPPPPKVSSPKPKSPPQRKSVSTMSLLKQDQLLIPIYNGLTKQPTCDMVFDENGNHVEHGELNEEGIKVVASFFSKHNCEYKVADAHHFNIWAPLKKGFQMTNAVSKLLVGKEAWEGGLKRHICKAQDPLNHIYSVFCSRNEYSFLTFIDFMASAVQRPWENSNISINIQGMQGIGKSEFFNRIFEPILGPANYVLVSGMEELLEKFSAGVADKIMVVVDEVTWLKLPTVKKNKLKTCITSKKNKSEQKFQPIIYIPNYWHLITITNGMEPCPLEEHKQRRYFPLVVTMSHVFEPEEQFDTSRLKQYGEMLLTSIDMSIDVMASLLYTWPTYRLDRFNAGHGVSNQHLTILAAASKRYTLQHSIASQWWFTLSDKKSVLYLSLLQEGYTKDVLPGDLYCDANKPIFCCEDPLKPRMNDVRSLMTLYSRNEERTLQLQGFLADFEEAVPSNGVIRIAKLKEMAEKNSCLDLVGSLIDCWRKETDEETVTRLLDVAECIITDETKKMVMDILKLRTRSKKISKANFFKLFEAWYTDLPSEKKTSSDKLPNSDLLAHQLRPYVPWLFEIMDSNWLLIGDVESCRKNLDEIFKTTKNIESSKRGWFDIINEVYSGNEDNHDIGFETKFADDKSFHRDKDGNWFARLIVEWGEFQLPVLVPLDDEKKHHLMINKQMIWNEWDVQNKSVPLRETDDVLIRCMISHSLLEEIDEEDKLSRAAKILNDIQNMEMTDLDLSQHKNSYFSSCSGFYITSKSKLYWNYLYCDKDGKANHQKNSAYKLVVVK